ncbi:MAG: tetratricopeptide repeat protein, partial [Cyanobacteriota bacterium]
DINKKPGAIINYYLDLFDTNTQFIRTLLTSENIQHSNIIEKYLKDLIGKDDSYTIDLGNDIYSYELIKSHSEFLQLLASKSFVNKDILYANDMYSSSIKMNSELLLSYINYGLTEIALTNYDKALNIFINAAELVDNDYQNDIVMLYIGMCHLYLQRYEKAINSVINIQNDTVEKFLVLGNACFILKDYEDAIESYSWALILDKNPIIYINLGLVYDKINDKESATDNYSKAADINPDLKVPALPYLPVFRKIPYSLEEL